MEAALQREVAAVVLLSSDSEGEEAAPRRERAPKRARKRESVCRADAPATARSPAEGGYRRLRIGDAKLADGEVIERRQAPRRGTRRSARTAAGVGGAGARGAAAAAAAAAAPRKRQLAGSQGSAAHCGTASRSDALVEVKQEIVEDGGWPAEYQQLRAEPYDSADYDRLRRYFFTKCDVHHPREILTRRGTRRFAVTRQKLRIEEWPQLQEAASELHEAESFALAHAHLRCLEHYLQQACHPSVPRILRTVKKTCADDEGIIEEVNLAGEQKARPQSIDVEAVPHRSAEIKIEPGAPGAPHRPVGKVTRDPDSNSQAEAAELARRAAMREQFKEGVHAKTVKGQVGVVTKSFLWLGTVRVRLGLADGTTTNIKLDTLTAASAAEVAKHEAEHTQWAALRKQFKKGVYARTVKGQVGVVTKSAEADGFHANQVPLGLADGTATEIKVDTLVVCREAEVAGYKTELARWVKAASERDFELDHRETTLMRAAYNGHCYAVGALLDAGADEHVDECAENFRPPLLLAADNGHSAVITLLLNAGADVNIQDSNGDTALTSVCSTSGDSTVCVQLLEAGADPTLENEDGDRALGMSAYHGDLECDYALRCWAVGKRGRILQSAIQEWKLAKDDDRTMLESAVETQPGHQVAKMDDYYRCGFNRLDIDYDLVSTYVLDNVTRQGKVTIALLTHEEAMNMALPPNRLRLHSNRPGRFRKLDAVNSKYGEVGAGMAVEWILRGAPKQSFLYAFVYENASVGLGGWECLEEDYGLMPKNKWVQWTAADLVKVLLRLGRSVWRPGDYRDENYGWEMEDQRPEHPPMETAYDDDFEKQERAVAK